MLFYIMSDPSARFDELYESDNMKVDTYDSGSDKSDESDESGSGIRYSSTGRKKPAKEKPAKASTKYMPDVKLDRPKRKKRLSEVYLNKDFESKLLPYQYKYLNEVIKTCNLSEIEKEAIVEAKDMAEELDTLTDKEFDDLMKDLSISKGGNLNKQKGGTNYTVVYLSFLLLMGKNAPKAIHFLSKLGKDYLIQWFAYFNRVTGCFQQLYTTTMVRVYPVVLHFIQHSQEMINENAPILIEVYLFLLNNGLIYIDHIVSTLAAFEAKLNVMIDNYNEEEMNNQLVQLKEHFSTLKTVVEDKKKAELNILAQLENESTKMNMEFSEKIVESARIILNLTMQLEIQKKSLETLKNSEDILRQDNENINMMMEEIETIKKKINESIQSIQSISSDQIGGGKKSHRTKKHHKKKSRRTKSKKKRSQAARRKKKM